MGSCRFSNLSLAVGLIATAMILFFPATSFAELSTQESVTMEEMLRDGDEQAADGEHQAQTRESEGQDDEKVATPPRNQPDPNWALIIGQNALWGGITGGLIGLGVWLVTGQEFSPWIIAQVAGGGILVGAVIGIIALSVHTERYSQQPTSIEAPRPSVGIPMLRIEF